MLNHQSARRKRAILGAAALAAAAVIAQPLAADATSTGHASHRASSHSSTAAPKPSIVLVHGAWADASSWNAEISRLQHDGYTVYAPPNPLRGVAYDAATIRDFVKSIPGPVVLVGHSYGGMVITNAARGASNVKALVYDDAYIPAKGQTVFEINQTKPGSCVVAADPTTFLNLVTYPGAAKGDYDAYLKVAANGSYPGFDKCFANGVNKHTAALLAAGQRPFAVSAGSDKSGAPAWAKIPSWAIVGTQDHVIPPAEQLAMARHAHAKITKVSAGHLSLVSRPGVVTSVIEKAARTVK